VSRKGSEKFIPIKVVLKLVERLRYSRDWRRQRHEQLAVMTGSTRGLEDIKHLHDKVPPSFPSTSNHWPT